MGISDINLILIDLSKRKKERGDLLVNVIEKFRDIWILSIVGFRGLNFVVRILFFCFVFFVIDLNWFFRCYGFWKF